MKYNYIRLKKSDITETIEAINKNASSQKSRTLFQNELVKLSSLRLKTFARCGTKCSDCGLEASYFAFEKSNSDIFYHLNLWGVNEKGNEVLFTHDHTIARGLGGSNKLDNTTTMCVVCNQKKSVIESELCFQMHKAREEQAVA
jgi:hypothetical protein